jgi:hypothetical protein
MPAWEHMKRILFSPFDWRKWAALGLVALLAGTMQGGGNGGGGNFGGGPGGPGGDFEDFKERVEDWWGTYQSEIIAGGAALVVIGIGLSLLMLYISSVFRFMFLEAVITDEVRIRHSWVRNKAVGISFMWWRLCLNLLATLALALFIGLPVAALVLPTAGGDWGSGLASGSGMLLILYAIFMIAALSIVGGLISAMTRDFVLPIMHRHRVSTLEGWHHFWPILCGNKVGFAVYFLLKIALSLGAGIASVIGACLGILVAAIPLGLIGLVGYGLVMAFDITTWNWWYLTGLIPVGFVLMLLLSYWMTCVLLPIPVFFQGYALKYLGYADAKLETI